MSNTSISTFILTINCNNVWSKSIQMRCNQSENMNLYYIAYFKKIVKLNRQLFITLIISEQNNVGFYIRIFLQM